MAGHWRPLRYPVFIALPSAVWHKSVRTVWQNSCAHGSAPLSPQPAPQPPPTSRPCSRRRPSAATPPSPQRCAASPGSQTCLCRVGAVLCGAVLCCAVLPAPQSARLLLPPLPRFLLPPLCPVTAAPSLLCSWCATHAMPWHAACWRVALCPACRQLLPDHHCRNGCPAWRAFPASAACLLAGDKDGFMFLWDLRSPTPAGAFGAPDATGWQK